MKIESRQTQAQNLQNKVNNTKIANIKPTFKEIPDEFVSETMKNAGEHNGLWGYVASGLAIIGAGVAFFRNRKARIAKQIAENEKEVIKRAKSEAEDTLARLKAENEALNKSIDEWNKAILSPTKNNGTNTAGTSQSYSSGGRAEGNRAGSRTSAGSSGGRAGTKVEGATVNNAKHSANISMSEEDKKYFEKTKQELLEAVDKSEINEDIKKELVNEIKEYITSILNSTNGIEQQKTSLDLYKGIIADQLEMTSKFSELQKTLCDLKEFFVFADIKKKQSELASKRGFDRILGYQTQKDFLNEKLIKPLKTNGKTPNIILMYGPKGTGKTLFGESAALEAQANFINIDLSMIAEENLQNLKDAANKAKENFEKTRKRSVLLINEIDGVKCDKEYADIINNLSKKYHSTLIATTNYPKNVDSTILNVKDFEKLYMPTASKDDIAKILEYVLKDFSESGVDYKELAEKLVNKANGRAYSNDKIYETASDIVTEYCNTIIKMKNQKNISSDLIPAISKQKIVDTVEKIEPDISKEIINSYNNIF